MWLVRLRYSLRSLARDPVFVSVVVLVLSLGIAANTTIFAVIDQIVLNPLPYRDPDRLVMVWEANPSMGDLAGSRVPAAWSNFAAWRDQNHAFTAIEAFETAGYNLTGLGAPEHLLGARASGGFFQMLGTGAKRGRVLAPDDARPGAPPVVVVTDAFANSYFAGRDPVGQKILLNGIPRIVIGVLPWDFHLPAFFEGSNEYKPDLWTPLAPVTSADPPEAAKWRRLLVFARLKNGMPLAQARAEMSTLAVRLAQADPDLNRGYGINIVPLKIENADADLGRALYILWTAAFVVLLLGCVNLAGLMLVRAINRQKDLAIMGALGAPRSVLVANILTESSVLALVSATLAVAGSYAGIHVIRALQPGDIFGMNRVAMNWRSLLFAGVAFVVSVLLFGLLPAWLGARSSFSSALKRAAGTGSNRAGSMLRRILVTGEVFVALVLAIGATLLARSFQQILAVDPGYRPENVLTARIALAPPRYATPDDQRHFCQLLLDRVRQLPGVKTASLVDNFPLYAIHYASFEIDGRPLADTSDAPVADYASVSSEFFESMGTPLRTGRLFTPADMQDHALGVAILNETLARKFWPNQDPVGGHIRLVFPHHAPGPWQLVVGVVRDFRQFNIETPARPEMFWPAREFPEMTVVLRTTSDPAAAGTALQKAVAEIDKDQPLSDVQTFAHIVAHSISQRRFNMLLLSGFAGLSILLALVGVYGLVSYIISSRLRDIGIRVTLGAQPKHVFSALILEILPFAATGIVLGLLGSLLVAWLAKKLIAGLLFGISAFDLPTYLSLPLVLIALAVLTCALPAARAARTEPANVLRHE
jgi:putative ABC transport system permease protein